MAYGRNRLTLLEKHTDKPNHFIMRPASVRIYYTTWKHESVEVAMESLFNGKICGIVLAPVIVIPGLNITGPDTYYLSCATLLF